MYTLSRTVDPVTGILRTERLLTSQQPIPSIVRRVFNAFTPCSPDGPSPHSTDVAYAYEVSEIDPTTQECTAYSVNLTFNNVMRIRERLRFASELPNSESTVFEQTAEVTATGALKRFAGMVEDFSISRFASNAALGRQGLQQAIDRICDETKGALDRLEDRAKDVVEKKLEDLVKDLAVGSGTRIPAT
ncbi:hypothetical protein HDU93_000280 [Gonapodya sp. JEL0774]|nr:hypothetical protein HDU93_000280 [Gonapodya sp. JEL0774]